jgi:hypothetical protein
MATYRFAAKAAPDWRQLISESNSERTSQDHLTKLKAHYDISK